MWDHVTDRILAKYGKTITHEQRMANMTLTVEGTAAMFVQQLGVPLTEPECAELIRAEARYGYAQEATVSRALSRCWQPCTHVVCVCAWHPAPKHR